MYIVLIVPRLPAIVIARSRRFRRRFQPPDAFWNSRLTNSQQTDAFKEAHVVT
jgi:hypothetical protein